MSGYKFSIEFIEDDKNTFDNILNLLSSPSFRLGGGSTKGFGKFSIENIKTTSIECSSSLNDGFKGEGNYIQKEITTNYTTYILNIKPDDFFMFGSGFGDDEADMTPVYERVIKYDGEKSGLSEEQILIPASSIKGAIAHRTTYHFNKLKGNTIEAKNGAKSIKEIFGEAKNSKQNIMGSKGKALFSDCFKGDNNSTKVFDHVSIDRFTGGAIDGALFQEKTVADNDTYTIEILLENSIDEVYIKAFEASLNDICNGMLPLGGATTKGHGVFSGTWSKS